MEVHGNRRVIIGNSAEQRSSVIEIQDELPTFEAKDRIFVQEIWRQASVPALPGDTPQSHRELDLDPPAGGALVRILTVMPHPDPTHFTQDLHADNNRHILTLISGQVDLILQEEVVTLSPGDSMVLTGSDLHDWKNLSDTPAVAVYTSFPLSQ